MEEISATEPDWSREALTGFWQPGRQLLRAIRGYQRIEDRFDIISRFRKRLYVQSHRFWSIVTGADIPIQCKIGGGLLIPHPNGIVIHPDARIGVNCLLFQQVTIGTHRGGGVPTLQGHVDIGAGAKILGPVEIPSHSLVSANAVVTSWPPKNRTKDDSAICASRT